MVWRGLGGGGGRGRDAEQGGKNKNDLALSSVLKAISQHSWPDEEAATIGTPEPCGAAVTCP